MQPALDPSLTDEDLTAHGIPFDPERHVVGEDGRPVKTTNGYFKVRPGAPKQAGRTTGRPPGRPPGVPNAPKGRREPDYRGGILGIMQLAAAPLAFTYPADAAAVITHAPPIADALHALALERPEVARVLDTVLAVGPYGAVIAAVLPLVVQLLHNHGVISVPMAVSLGATPKDEILAALGQSVPSANGSSGAAQV